jgi:TonB family protein
MSLALRSRFLLALLFVATAGLVVAKPDTGPTPVLYKREAHFSKRYDPNLKPDHLAIPVHLPPLIYPTKWEQWGQPAYAVVEFLVADTGAPEEVQCTEATDRAFAKAAQTAVERTYFQPALKNQQGCYSKIVQRIEFYLPQTKGANAAGRAAPAKSAPAAAPAAAPAP